MSLTIRAQNEIKSRDGYIHSRNIFISVTEQAFYTEHTVQLPSKQEALNAVYGHSCPYTVTYIVYYNGTALKRN